MELIRQIIRTHNLHIIYPGRNQAAFNDLVQVAYVQIESVLYKFAPGKAKVFNMFCVVPDTLLYTKDGIKKIGQCVGNEVVDETDFEVYGISGLNKAISYFRRPVSDTIRITTAQGYNIEATKEHEFLNLDSDGLKWVQAQELKKGDLLAIQYNQNCFGGDDRIDFKPRHGDFKGWLPPKKWNADLAYLMGLTISEGCLYKLLAICNAEKEVLSFLKRKPCGLSFSLCKIKQFCQQRCNNPRIMEFIGWLGIPRGTTAPYKFIPDKILKCSRHILRWFLRGMFDGDGHSSRFDGTVGYTSTSKKLINQLRVLLLNFGIVTKTSVDKRRLSKFCMHGKSYTSKRRITYQLCMSTTDSLKFYKLIGFGIKRKQAKSAMLRRERIMLPSVIMKKIGELVSGSSMSRNHVDKMTRGTRKHGLQIHNVLKRRIGVTVNMLIDILDTYKDEAHLSSHQYLRDRCLEYGRIAWLPIVKLENSRSETIDIRVPATRSFTANGIIVSNSQIAKTCILAHIKKETRDRKNSTPYSSHLNERFRNVKNILVDRFIQEASEKFKYNKEYMKIVKALKALSDQDNRPYDGLIGKLARRTKLSKAKISSFIRLVRLNGQGFTDSGMGEKSRHFCVRHLKDSHDSIDDED